MLNFNQPIVFDLETDGSESQRIIQIGAVAPHSGETFEVKVKFDRRLANSEILEMNSYDEHEWGKYAVTEEVAQDMFAGFLRKHSSIPRVAKSGRVYKVAALMGYNAAAFDMPLLIKWFNSREKFLPADFRVFDVYQLAIWFVDSERYTLGEVAEKIWVGRPGTHDALVDAEITADVAAVILGYLCQGRKEPRWIRRRLRLIGRRIDEERGTTE